MKRASDGAESAPKRIIIPREIKEGSLELSESIIIDAVRKNDRVLIEYWLHTEHADKEDFHNILTRAVIDHGTIELWRFISTDKAVYWHSDDIVRNHLARALSRGAKDIALDLISKNIPLQSYEGKLFDSKDKERKDDGLEVKGYIGCALSIRNNEEKYKDFIVGLLNKGLDINEGYDDVVRPKSALHSAAFSSEPEKKSNFLIANGVKFRHLTELNTNTGTKILETLRLYSKSSELRLQDLNRIARTLSTVVMAHYKDDEQINEVNMGINSLTGEAFNVANPVSAFGEQFSEEQVNNMMQNLNLAEGNIMTRETFLHPMRAAIRDNLSTFLSDCLNDRLIGIAKIRTILTSFYIELETDTPMIESMHHHLSNIPLVSKEWRSTVFHSFGWNCVADVKAAIDQNPNVVNQITNSCIARLQLQNSQQLGL